MDYDVLILGGGPAGYYCALECAKGGLKTALVEKQELGGTGLRWGCLPVKRMLDALRERQKAEKILFSRSSADVQEIYKGFLEEMQGIEIQLAERLSARGVEIFFGEGSFLTPHTYLVGERCIEAAHIVIATGTSPKGFQQVEEDGEYVITHKDAVSLEQLPKTMTIIGANVEGCEFAALFAALGVDVFLLEKENQILKGMDRDLVQPLLDQFEMQGVKIKVDTAVEAVDKTGSRPIVLLSDGSMIEAEKVLVTMGRKPNFPLGLDQAGVFHESQRIPVDSCCRTSNSHIYAVGDINGIGGMAHMAIQQGILAADNILGKRRELSSGIAVPSAIFTIPEIAGLGCQEQELLASRQRYKVGKYPFSHTWRGFTKGIQSGFVKVLFDQKNKLLGLWMAGDDVSEYIGLLHSVFRKGISLKDLEDSLAIHPSLLEAVWKAARNLEEREGVQDETTSYIML
ncbi:dihydrolipoyl dehydrogenase family protein [Geosporobacter ferrireducens]|uniref:dihydrolipoyl dehydrogenase family protein n=1 Tax=Geosporobacter ferrireducens TaxID=1424294 RepID=UPI00139D1A3B|nr:NAD(P)/FAD-dependent oxidoreductase [Geosporobacter ferrireducens]MTI54528.1 NAD(P)/FAD-dependent oxidoreductase [Geosporobacter ferrireducens]